MLDTDHYVLLPKSGFIEKTDDNAGGSMHDFPHQELESGHHEMHIEIEGNRHLIKVIDSVCEGGPKLIEMEKSLGDKYAASDMTSDFRLVKAGRYRTCGVGASNMQPKQALSDTLSESADSDFIKLSITVTDAVTGEGIPDASVIAYFDFANKKGSTGTTDSQGGAMLTWSKKLPKIPQLLVIPSSDLPIYWGVNELNVATQAQMNITMDTVNTDYCDSVRTLYPDPSFDTNLGIVVGIVDTGVSQHEGLNLIGGENLVKGESPDDYGSNGDPHGTHVAGITGAYGKIDGIAPGVALRSYRVFGKGSSDAAGFDIAKAVSVGVSDQCDVLNLSLGVSDNDMLLEEAIEHARNSGTLVIAAGNNNYGGEVGYPAAFPNTVAISAMGRVGTVPTGSQPEVDLSSDEGSDANNRLATFTSVGKQVDYIGPGVGVISTIPGNLYGQLSGTSMACPVVSGCMASILAGDTAVNKAERNRQRSDTMATLLQESSDSLGFSVIEQGDGLPKST